MEFHAWAQSKLSDPDRAKQFYKYARDEYKVDKDVGTFASIVNDILKAQSGNKHEFLAELYHVRAIINRYNGDYLESLRDYDCVLEINPRNMLARNERDVVDSLSPQDSEAESAIVTCLYLYQSGQHKLQSTIN